MSVEEIARRFEDLPGHDLVDCAHVGLPIFRMIVEAVTMVRRPVNPISEFVLRSVDAGLESRNGIASFLGLDEGIVGATLEQLRMDGAVNHVEPPDGVGLHYGTSNSGREMLRDAAVHRPQEQTLTIDYDAILGKPIWLEEEPLDRSADLVLRNAVEIHPYPADPPRATDLDIAEVNAVLGRQYRYRDDGRFDLLALRRTSRTLRLFRPAVGLVFRMRSTKDVRVVFVVDGGRREDLEQAFAKRNGPRKMGIVRDADAGDVQARIRRRLGRDLMGGLPKDDDVRRLRRAVSTARLRNEANLRKFERSVVPEEKRKAEEEAQHAGREAEERAAELLRLPIRQMAVYEGRELLVQAIEGARQRLWIGSTSVRDNVLVGELGRAFERLVGRNVDVRLLLTNAQTQWGQGRQEREAFRSLNDLMRRRPNLSLVPRPGGDGLHYLLVDDVLAVVTNQPFLANAGKVRSFGNVQGMVLRGPDLVLPFYARLESEGTGK